MSRKFTIFLNAFVTTHFVSRWVTIWSGDSLSDLSSKEFKCFKEIYGLKNLALNSYYQYDFDSFYDDDSFF